MFFSLNSSRQIVRPEQFNERFSAYSVGQHGRERGKLVRASHFQLAVEFSMAGEQVKQKI